MLRKIIYFITASLDGFIARPGGEIDWLIQPSGGEDFGFADFLRSVDTVVQGRRTYEQVLSLGPYPYVHLKNYVFSRKLLRADHAEIVRQTVPDFVAQLQRRQGGDIWLVGGGQLAAAFFQAKAVDTVRVFVQPILLGQGISLAGALGNDVRLNLKSTRPYAQGLVELEYEVAK